MPVAVNAYLINSNVHVYKVTYDPDGQRVSAGTVKTPRLYTKVFCGIIETSRVCIQIAYTRGLASPITGVSNVQLQTTGIIYIQKHEKTQCLPKLTVFQWMRGKFTTYFR